MTSKYQLFLLFTLSLTPVLNAIKTKKFEKVKPVVHPEHTISRYNKDNNKNSNGTQATKKGITISKKARIGYIDVKSLKHLPMELGFVLEGYTDRDGKEKTRLKKGPKAEEIEILYNLIVVRCIATKKGRDEFDDFISGRRLKGKAIVPFEQYKKEVRAMLINIKRQMRRKIVINISREELMHGNRWRYEPSKDDVKKGTNLSKYMVRLAKFIPDLGFSGVLFEMPTVGPQTMEIKLTAKEKNKKSKNKKGNYRIITFDDPRLEEEMLFEFLQAMFFFKKAFTKKSTGRIFAIKVSDSTLLAHKLIKNGKEMAKNVLAKAKKGRKKVVFNLETGKLIDGFSKMGIVEFEKKVVEDTIHKFKSLPDYILVIYEKIDAIRQHIINRYYSSVSKDGKVLEDQIPKALTKKLYGVGPQEESVKKEILLLQKLKYSLGKIVLIISTSVLKIEHDKAGKSLMQSLIFQQYNYVHEFCDPPTEEEKNAFLGLPGRINSLQVLTNKAKPVTSYRNDHNYQVKRSRAGVYSRVEKGKVVKSNVLEEHQETPKKRTKRAADKGAGRKAEVDANSLMILRSVQVVTPQKKVVTVTVAYHEADLLCELVFDSDFGKYGLGGAAIFTVDTDGACKKEGKIHYFEMSKSVFDHFRARVKPGHASLLHEVDEDEAKAWDEEHKQTEDIIVWQKYGKTNDKFKAIDKMIVEEEQRRQAEIQKKYSTASPNPPRAKKGHRWFRRPIKRRGKQ